MSNRKLFHSHIETQMIINYLTGSSIIGEEQATFWHQVSGQWKGKGCFGISTFSHRWPGSAPALLHCSNPQCLLLCPETLLYQHSVIFPAIYNVHCMPLINLQAVPAWKLFVLGAEQDQVHFSQTGRTWWDRSSTADPCPAGAPKWAHFVSPSNAQDSALPLPSAPFGMSLTQTLPGTAAWSCFHPLGPSKAAGWQTEPQSSRLVPAKPLCCCWGETTSLHPLCVVLTTLWRESYPGHPHRSLQPPQLIAASESLKNQAPPLRTWTNSSLRSCLHLRGVRERHSHGRSPQKPPPVLPPHSMAGFSQDTPWRAVPGAGRALGWLPAHGGGCKSQSQGGTCCGTRWQQGSMLTGLSTYQCINTGESPQGKDNNLLYQMITLMSQDCK